MYVCMCVLSILSQPLLWIFGQLIEFIIRPRSDLVAPILERLANVKPLT